MPLRLAADKLKHFVSQFHKVHQKVLTIRQWCSFSPRNASWLGQPTAAGGEISGMKSSPQTASKPILILCTAWSIDTWAEHAVKIRATVGDLDKQVTLSECIRPSVESDGPFKHGHRVLFQLVCIEIILFIQWKHDFLTICTSTLMRNVCDNNRS